MRLMKLTCSSCNAQLDIDLDHLQAYCPYCGQKLLLDFEQFGDVLSEKEKTKQTATREEAQTKRVQMEYEHESREKDKEWKKKAIAVIGLVLIFFFVVFYIPEHMFDSDKKEHDEKVAYLQQMEIEIDDAIQAGDYDGALLKVNKLYCDDNWSDSETAAWDAKREAYIEIIQEKKREVDVKDPNNIFVPASSATLAGKNYKDVETAFIASGFSNISTKGIAPVGTFGKENTVAHIIIGGKTEFSIEDYFNKDTPIIIYYYQKHYSKLD